MVWFNSDDADAASAKVAELGGSVIMPPMDMSFGRATVVADPQGTVFGIGKIDAPED
jgi:predicted enzyme related to lactoylglutathione lyase